MAELEGAQRDAAAARGDVDPADLDAVHHLVETLAGDAAEDPAGRDADVGQDQFGGVDALVAHLLDLPRHGQARHLRVGAEAWFLLDQERGHVLVRGVVPLIGVAQHRHQVGGAAVGQPHLLAVEDEVLAVGLGPGADGRDVGAQAGLGHGEGAPHVARRHLGQEVFLLLVGAVPADHVAPR